MQRKIVALITFGIATLSNAKAIPRQSVALVLCNDVINPDGTSNGQCQSMTTATDHCMNEFQDFNNGGSWIHDPRGVIIDAPAQHCVLFEDGFCDFDNDDKRRFVYGPHSVANVTSNFGTGVVHSIACFYHDDNNHPDNSKPLAPSANHLKRRALPNPDSAEIDNGLAGDDAQQSASSADEESLSTEYEDVAVNKDTDDSAAHILPTQAYSNEYDL